MWWCLFETFYIIYYTEYTFTGTLSDLRQFLATKNPLKMLKNAFYFTLKALFVLEIFKFLFWLFGHVGKLLDMKTNEKFKPYAVTNWETNNYNTHTARYFKKLFQLLMYMSFQTLRMLGKHNLNANFKKSLSFFPYLLCFVPSKINNMSSGKYIWNFTQNDLSWVNEFFSSKIDTCNFMWSLSILIHCHPCFFFRPENKNIAFQKRRSLSVKFQESKKSHFPSILFLKVGF